MELMGEKETMKELRRYSAELKAEAVKMVIEQGLTQEETGKRLSIPKGNIGNWVGAARARWRRAALESNRWQSWPRECSSEERTGRSPHGAGNLKKSHGVLRKGVIARYAFMKAYRLVYPVKLMARVLEVSRSGLLHVAEPRAVAQRDPRFGVEGADRIRAQTKQGHLRPAKAPG